MVSILVWENIHFAVYLFAALSFLAAFWLYIDAWSLERKIRRLPGLIGWLVLALAFGAEAAHVEVPALLASVFKESVFTQVIPLVRLSGYLLVAFSVFFDKLQRKPKVTGLVRPKNALADTSVVISAAFWKWSFLGVTVSALLPLSAWLVSWAYWRRAGRGLERHVRPARAIFFIFGVYELLWLGRTWRVSTNPALYNLVAPFGVLWAVEHIVLLTAAILLVAWVTKYLLGRLRVQLFMLFNGMVLVIFLVATATFSVFLLRNVQDAQLQRLGADARMVQFSWNTLREGLISDTELIASDSRLPDMVVAADEQSLAGVLSEYETNKNIDTLAITDIDGKILAWGDRPEKIGGSISEDPLVIKAVKSQAVASGFVRRSGVLASVIEIRAAALVRQDGIIKGVVIAGKSLDNAFLDGIKSATGLDVALYGDKDLSASTITVGSDMSRWIGTDVGDEKIVEAVLGKKAQYTGLVQMLNTEYLVAFNPILGVDGEALGMFSVGVPQREVDHSAGAALQLTFLAMAVLMLLATIPAYVVAYEIGKQVRL
ncbi:MAG: cache domain-containing protein [Candidatus Andersenbacteria bacterium]|nr:cache domain-containing protein [bacterium]MDZ4225593.1 cache domain-containing protein [Candidatus Andersenbacteria bacterium]